MVNKMTTEGFLMEMEADMRRLLEENQSLKREIDNYVEIYKKTRRLYLEERVARLSLEVEALLRSLEEAERELNESKLMNGGGES